MTDTDAHVVMEASNSVEQLFRWLPWRQRFRFVTYSFRELVGKARQEPHKQRAALAIAAGTATAVGGISLIPAYMLKLGGRQGWLAQGLRRAYRGWFRIVARSGEPFLTRLISEQDESHFWTSIFRSMMAYFVGDRYAIVPLLPFLSSPSEKQQLLVLGHAVLREPEAGQMEHCLLEALVNAKTKRVIWQTANRLYAVNKQLAVSTLLTQIRESTSPEVRSTSLDALRRARDLLEREQLVLVRQALNDISPTVRKTACLVLGQMKDVDSISAIHHLAHDDTAAVRATACETLARLGQTGSIGILRPMLADDDEAVRNAAYDALWQICRQNAIHLQLSDKEP